MLPAVLLALVPAQEPAAPPLAAPTPVRMWWGDFDGDALPDLLVAGAEGRGMLLRNRGRGAFEDVTEGSGAGRARGSGGRVVGRRRRRRAPRPLRRPGRGPPRLYRNLDRGVFEELAGFAEVAGSGAVRAHAWLDFDADGLLDLHLATDGGERLLHNLGEGRFEPAVLPETARVASAWTESAEGAVDAASGPRSVDDPALEESSARRTDPTTVSGPAGTVGEASSRAPIEGRSSDPTGGGGASDWTGSGLDIFTPQCAGGVEDAATMNCVVANTVPTLGDLYPLGPEFNINVAGQVGIGTTDAGTAHVKVEGDQTIGLHAVTTGGTGGLGDRLELRCLCQRLDSGRAGDFGL